jgi:DNA-binding CsgD family transcriptional regulator
VAVLRGPAGIGKTALLDYAAAVTAEWRILTTSGMEWEADLPYVNLADLVRPVADFLDRIPPRQAAALAGAVAIGPPAANDRFAVAAATLSLLGAVAEDGPVLVSVDDSQWLDRFSLEALGFASRRLRAEGVAVLFALRDDQPSPPSLVGIEELPLSGLDERSARELLVAHGGDWLTESVVARVIAETDGNPLALVELPVLLQRGQIEQWIRTDEPVPVGEVLARAFGRSVAGLPRATQDALLVLAILGSSPTPVADATLGALGLGRDSIGPAEAAGLVLEQRGRLGFRHPLIRAAVYRLASSTVKRQAHEAAAVALGAHGGPNGLERQAGHLAAAGRGPDDGVALRLHAAGDDARRQSNYAVAGRLFARAAEFCSVDESRGIYLVQAAEATWLAGAVDETAALLDKALEFTDNQRLRLEIRHYRCRIAMWASDPRSPRDGLVSLATEAEPVDPRTAAVMLAGATLASLAMGDTREAQRTSARAVALTEDLDFPVLPVHLLRAFTLIVTGDSRNGGALLERCGAALREWDPLSSDEMTLIGGLCYLGLERLTEARELMERAAAAARNASAIGLLPFQLSRLSHVEYCGGNWNASLALAHEALRLARDTGWRTEVPNSLTALARIEASLGRVDDCRRHANAAIDIGNSSGLPPIAAYAHSALAVLELGQSQPEEAAEHLEEVERFSLSAGLGETVLLPWAADLVEAYVRLGRPDDAERPMVELELAAAADRFPSAATLVARCRALLDPACVERVAAEFTSQPSGMPFEDARTRLCIGEQLRRQGHRREARRWLQSARSIFERLGASPWVRRTVAELGAAGSPGRESEPPMSAVLTPQELQVALSVAEGRTNRDVAAALFLSVKTVEFHLSNIYRKLGLTRRSQLVRLLLLQQDPTELSAAGRTV